MRNFKMTFCIFLILIFMMGILGCISNNKPSNIVKNYLEEVKNGENEKFLRLLNENIEKDNKNSATNKSNFHESQEKMLTSIKKLTYKINLEDINKNSAIVNVTIKAPDIAIAIGQFFKKAIGMALSDEFSKKNTSNEENQKIFDNILSKCLDDVKLEERTKDIHLEKIDGNWKIKDGNEMLKLITNIDESVFNVEK